MRHLDSVTLGCISWLLCDKGASFVCYLMLLLASLSREQLQKTSAQLASRLQGAASVTDG